MNKVLLIGRTTKDIEVKYSQGEEPIAVARFTLAVDGIKKDATDFISCIAYRKTAETLGKYAKKGTKIAVDGRISTGSYEKDGKKVYTTDILVNAFEFCESKKEESGNDGFVNIPDGIEEKLPFV